MKIDKDKIVKGSIGKLNGSANTLFKTYVQCRLGPNNL